MLNTILHEAPMSNTLLLNADMQPISLLPLSTVDWQEAIRYMVLDKAEVLEWYDNWVVRSARWETPVPAVLMLKDYQKPKNTMRLSKRNIFLRDEYVCQYCSGEVTESNATLDHVHPVSLGGKTTWENSTTACKSCNYRKAAHVGKFKPKVLPYKPHFWDLAEKRRRRGYHLQHPSWAYYLGIE
jgi:5-methylcytosine-specific restriction endonuclease McrA